MQATRRGFTRTAAALALLGSAGLIGAPLRAQSARRAAAGKLIVGQSYPMTGAANEIGLAFAAGAKLFIDGWNERGSGPTLELRQLDDGYDATRARANATKLLADGADVLFGFVGTASSAAASEVAQQQGAAFFAPFAAADALRDKMHPHVFHVRPSMADEAFAMLRHCGILGQTRIAVVADDDAMGRAALQAIQDAAAELKMAPPVAAAFVKPGGTQVADAVAMVAKAQPQTVIQASLSPTTAAFVREMRKTGYGSGFMTFSVVGIDPLYTALGKETRGVVISQVVPSPRSNGNVAIVKEYLAAVGDSDQTASYEGLEGFIAAKALAEAAKRAGPTATRASLQKAMAGMGAFDVGGFRINLRPPLHDAARAVDLVYITAEGRVLR
ncbi:ABC transporter substrate-binding protein [Variovorax sp. PAMC 28711]|uniref:ABC transporter substrate-binding protein n=1 Tax=Variovorax sp. PAMC 28711 TaxID=1795631 RepID=UPI00078E89B3|nr:ABC transporter substrate-binding protein [Variovorax sp. PAMC 28711]AMM25170.1 ABC transporter substrate-binding protein [Variovorax sp. PAMC 28711]